jgi:hypothetical protein
MEERLLARTYAIDSEDFLYTAYVHPQMCIGGGTYVDAKSYIVLQSAVEAIGKMVWPESVNACIFHAGSMMQKERSAWFVRSMTVCAQGR